MVSLQQWSANDASGFVLGALVWVLIVQYLTKGNGTAKDGPTAVRNWIRAKFLNKGPKGDDLP